MLTQFKNISCYEEFEIQCALTGISKVDVLKEIGYMIDNYYIYYFFISNDGIFNWFDSEGNHIKDPGILKSIYRQYIPDNIIKCIIPDNITTIGDDAFVNCYSLKEITIPNSVISIGGNNVFSFCNALKEVIFKGRTLEQVKQMENYPFGIEDISIIKCEM